MSLTEAHNNFLLSLINMFDKVMSKAKGKLSLNKLQKQSKSIVINILVI